MNQFIVILMDRLSLFCLSIAAIGMIYAIFAAVFVRFFARFRLLPALQIWPSVTILKPLHGIDPDLRENLEGFATQNYPGQVDLVFGLQSLNDPAIPLVRNLIAAHPDRKMRLIIDERQWGNNRKVSNLINMSESIEGDIVVLADSDISVDSAYLTRVVSTLCQPGTGLVTSLYYGYVTAGNLPNRMSAMGVDTHFLPNVITSLVLGLERPCLGSTIALSRSTLSKIGGFSAFADQLADDYAIGAAVTRLGQDITIVPGLVGHAASEASWKALWRHEIRWAQTIRIINPMGYFGLALTHALPFALLGLLFSGGSFFALSMVLGACLARFFLQKTIAFTFNLSAASFWLLPIRDILSFAVYLCSFGKRRVEWRGFDFFVQQNGTMRS